MIREATPAAWAEALEQLLGDPERLAAMGAAARAWSLAHTPTWHQLLIEDLLPAWRTAVGQLRGGERTLV